MLGRIEDLFATQLGKNIVGSPEFCEYKLQDYFTAEFWKVVTLGLSTNTLASMAKDMAHLGGTAHVLSVGNSASLRGQRQTCIFPILTQVPERAKPESLSCMRKTNDIYIDMFIYTSAGAVIYMCVCRSILNISSTSEITTVSPGILSC